MSYDVKCHELATSFLQDEKLINTPGNQDALSQKIQDVIEDFFLERLDEPCDECGHKLKLHDEKYGCEYERGDAWVTGNQPEQPTVLMAQGPCGCKRSGW